MDRDESPSPSPRRISPLDNSSFTSPPFTSTLPLPHPLTRPTSDSQLYTRKASTKMADYLSSPLRDNEHTRSATASIMSRSPSISPAQKPTEKNDKSFNMDDYTIDLGNLGQSSAGGRDLFAAMGGSDAETPIRTRDVVGSEDDGPEDFTINLGKWMKGDGGDGGWRKEDPGKEMEDPLEEQQEDAEEEGLRRDEKVLEGEGAAIEPVHEREFSDDGRKTGRPASVEDVREDEEQGSVVVHAPALHDKDEGLAHDRSTTPPTTPNQEKLSQNQVAEEVFNSISILQAEVERLRLEAEHYRREISALDSERAQSEAESEELAADLRDAKLTIAQLKKENADQKEHWDLELNKQKSSVSHVGSLRAKFEPLARELEVAKQELEAVKNESNVKVTALVEQLRTTQDELAESLEAVKRSHSDVTELTQLRSEFARNKQDILSQQQASRALEGTLRLENKDLQLRLKAMEEVTFDRNILRAELDDTQERLAQTQNLLINSKEENKHHEQQYLRHLDEVDALKEERDQAQRMVHENQAELNKRDARISSLEKENEQEKQFHLQDLVDAQNIELEKQFRQLDPEAADQTSEDDADNYSTDDGDNATDLFPQPPQAVSPTEQDMRLADQLDTLSTHYESQLASLKRGHEAELKKLKSVILRAAEGMRKREARLTSAHAAETSSLQRSIASLTSRQAASAARPPTQPAASSPHAGHNVPELRAAVRVLSAKLKTAQDELVATQDEVRALQREGEERLREREERERDREAVDRALEARLAQAGERREREWRRRMRVVLREREAMGKALLWGWGKEEVGEREEGGRRGMGYRYRFGEG
ncbi:hypothetical protein MMC13_002249 [Lambiella insularis]|nr:hypothetical protein [Lambiella insularis]